LADDYERAVFDDVGFTFHQADFRVKVERLMKEKYHLSRW
jgi:hypothetical protein